jgi:prepilin-type N-terminal cleavage/methylation domain-containing protein
MSASGIPRGEYKVTIFGVKNGDRKNLRRNLKPIMKVNMNTQHKSRTSLRNGAQFSQKGYTIVELSIAVAIAGVLLVSAIGLVQTVLTTNRANETATLLIKAMAQIDKIWADQPTYADLDLATAGASGVFNGMQVTRSGAGAVTGVNSKFNRPIYVGLASDIPTAASNRGYAVTFAGVPTSVCADLVTAVGGGGVRGILVTPEATAGATTAAIIPTGMDAAGVFTNPTGTISALDATSPLVNIARTMGADGCGTQRATVALTFLNWK